MLFLGIDPGITGAIALIQEDDNFGDEVTFWDAPITSVEGKTKLHNMLDPHAAAKILLANISSRDAYVVIEAVNAMPGVRSDGARVQMGSASAFNFGKGFGMWIGIPAALKYRYELVTPQVWKKKLCPEAKGTNKDAARIRARQMFPQAAESLNRKRDHGRADALLLAEFGRRSHAAIVARSGPASL